jgi:hypothetical protein
LLRVMRQPPLRPKPAAGVYPSQSPATPRPSSVRTTVGTSSSTGGNNALLCRPVSFPLAASSRNHTSTGKSSGRSCRSCGVAFRGADAAWLFDAPHDVAGVTQTPQVVDGTGWRLPTEMPLNFSHGWAVAAHGPVFRYPIPDG